MDIHPLHKKGEKMNAAIWLLFELIDLYVWALILYVIFSWLISFDVLNRSNRLVYMISDFLTRICQPSLRFIQRVIPPLGGIDISPIILILVLNFLKRFILEIMHG